VRYGCSGGGRSSTMGPNTRAEAAAVDFVRAASPSLARVRATARAVRAVEVWNILGAREAAALPWKGQVCQEAVFSRGRDRGPRGCQRQRPRCSMCSAQFWQHDDACRPAPPPTHRAPRWPGGGRCEAAGVSCCLTRPPGLDGGRPQDWSRHLNPLHQRQRVQLGGSPAIQGRTPACGAVKGRRWVQQPSGSLFLPAPQHVGSGYAQARRVRRRTMRLRFIRGVPHRAGGSGWVGVRRRQLTSRRLARADAVMPHASSQGGLTACGRSRLPGRAIHAQGRGAGPRKSCAEQSGWPAPPRLPPSGSPFRAIIGPPVVGQSKKYGRRRRRGPISACRHGCHRASSAAARPHLWRVGDVLAQRPRRPDVCGDA